MALLGLTQTCSCLYGKIFDFGVTIRVKQTKVFEPQITRISLINLCNLKSVVKRKMI